MLSLLSPSLLSSTTHASEPPKLSMGGGRRGCCLDGGVACASPDRAVSVDELADVTIPAVAPPPPPPFSGLLLSRSSGVDGDDSIALPTLDGDEFVDDACARTSTVRSPLSPVDSRRRAA
jgi:hypothetical protein